MKAPTLTLVTVFAASVAAPATADDVGVHPNGSQVTIHGEQIYDGQETGGDTQPDDSETYTAYDDGLCNDPNAMLVEKYQRAGLDDPWQLASSGCGATATVGPVVTPDLVLEAVRTVGLPVSTFEVPAKTLVNFETTVYTRAPVFERTVTVVGYQVDIRAAPSRFDWHFGDGADITTTDPGAPYPSTDITHTWTDAHRVFRPRVDTTYSVSYRVDDGPWLDIAEPLTVPGPESRVRIKEATPVLS